MIFSLPFRLAGRVKNSLSNAYESAKESRDAGYAKKVGIFLYSFSKSMLGIGKSKLETTNKTSKSVREGIDDVIARYKKAFGLDGKLEGKDKKFVDINTALAARGFGRVSGKSQGHAREGLDLQRKAVEKDKDPLEPLSFEQSVALGSVTLLTLKELKKKYPTQEKFKTAIRRISKLSGKAKYTLEKMLKFSVLGIFKVKSKEDRIRFLRKVKVRRSMGDIIGRGDMNDASDLLEGLSKKPLENKDQIVTFFRKRLFKKTKTGKIRKIVTLIHDKMTSGAKKMTLDDLTDLVFWINSADFDGIAKLFTGKLTKVSKEKSSAKEPEPAASASEASTDTSEETKSKAA